MAVLQRAGGLWLALPRLQPSLSASDISSRRAGRESGCLRKLTGLPAHSGEAAPRAVPDRPPRRWGGAQGRAIRRRVGGKMNTKHLRIIFQWRLLLVNHTHARSLTGCSEVITLRYVLQTKPYHLEITALTLKKKNSLLRLLVPGQSPVGLSCQTAASGQAGFHLHLKCNQLPLWWQIRVALHSCTWAIILGHPWLQLSENNMAFLVACLSSTTT